MQEWGGAVGSEIELDEHGDRLHGADPDVLSRIRAAMDSLYGDRIERLVLYGSRARGDALADSDYDVALFLHGLAMEDRFEELRPICDATTEILFDTGAVINVKPLPAKYYEERKPLMIGIRQDGIDF